MHPYDTLEGATILNTLYGDVARHPTPVGAGMGASAPGRVLIIMKRHSRGCPDRCLAL